MRLLPCVAALCLALPAWQSAAQTSRNFVTPGERSFFVFDWQKQGQPQTALRPAYPDAEKAAGVTGVVDAAVDIDNGGAIVNIRSLTSTPPVAAFEESVREALAQWQFFVFVDRDCKPNETGSRFRFTFQIANGEAKVTMARTDEAQPPADTRPTGAASLEWLNRQDVYSSFPYPPIARRHRAWAELMLKLTVDTASGEVTEAKVVVGRSNHPELLSYFVVGAEHTGKTARFRVVRPTELKQATYCVPVRQRHS